MGNHLILDLVYLTVFVFVLAPISRSASVPSSDLFLGIAPQDEKYYKSTPEIKCKDGSKKFTKAKLNDDFCDCPDGTDEPGTSACPTGKFYCRNAGHVPLSLFSSKVNDGICDCCDGSDEYDGKIKCINTCWKAGEVARDKLKKKIATFQEGVTLRKKEVEQAKLAISKDEAELSKLKSEEKVLKGLVQQLKEHKDQIEKAEEKERLQKEKEEKLKKEAEEKANQEKSIEEKAESDEGKSTGNAHREEIGTLDDSSSDKDGAEECNEALLDHYENAGDEETLNNEREQDEAGHKEETEVISESGLDASKGGDVSENTEGLSREELGRLVASRWTGENSGQPTEDNDDAVKDVDDENHSERSKDINDEEYGDDDVDSQRYDDDDEADIDDNAEEKTNEDFGDEDHHDDTTYKSDSSDDENEFSDSITSSYSSWLEKIQQTVRKILQAVNLFKSPVDKSEAARVRKEYDEANGKLSKIRSKISSLTEKLKHDFGPEKEFYSFYGRCFESKQNKYVYKVCPYKQASQVEGHSTTRLGDWEKFEDTYRVMLFSNGDKCWNGPDRSLKVKLRCGLSNEVTDVDEPSRCEYVALLSTPALCLEEKLKELQDKLESMNREQPQKHDEL